MKSISKLFLMTLLMGSAIMPAANAMESDPSGSKRGMQILDALNETQKNYINSLEDLNDYYMNDPIINRLYQSDPNKVATLDSHIIGETKDILNKPDLSLEDLNAIKLLLKKLESSYETQNQNWKADLELRRYLKDDSEPEHERQAALDQKGYQFTLQQLGKRDKNAEDQEDKNAEENLNRLFSRIEPLEQAIEERLPKAELEDAGFF